jgi:hypothetical protein
VPVRSVLSGTAVAVTVVTATLTFGSGLSTLVAHPALYGWNWTYALFSETGPDVPPQAVALLGHDPDVAAYSDATLADPEINGRIIPSIFERAGAPVTPPILSGHAVQENNQIVLGAATVAELGSHVGGTVTLTYGSKSSAPYYVPPTVLHVVGTATMPAIGFPSSEGDHTSMGTGALLSNGIIPAAFQKALGASPDPTLNGPEFVFVKMRSGVSQANGRADIRRIALAGNKAFVRAPNGDGSGDTVVVSSDLLPAEIVNYRSMGATPSLLAASLALGAVVALALTLVTSVRRRRRDLALLKTLGFRCRHPWLCRRHWWESPGSLWAFRPGSPSGAGYGCFSRIRSTPFPNPPCPDWRWCSLAWQCWSSSTLSPCHPAVLRPGHRRRGSFGPSDAV